MNKTKSCSKCHKNKQFSEFHKDKYSKDGYKSYCKFCVKNYYEQNKTKMRKRQKEYYEQNKSKINKRQVEYNKKYQKEYIKKYMKEHRKERNKYSRNWKKHRKIHDINFKILSNLRTRVYCALKRNSKSAKTIQLLGCSIEFLKKYLKNQFKSNMSWDNYGKYWEIDHIKPCVSFDFEKSVEQRKCFNYKNLRPLTVSENRRKWAKGE